MTQQLEPQEIRNLRSLAGTIIPASDIYHVPGAVGAAIFADILGSLARDHDDIRRALAQLAALSGTPFADMHKPQRVAIAEKLRAAGGSALGSLVRVVLLCYYRDDRVMRSLGQETRPPFPKGHVVEQGDWSLLDPVRQRAPMYRVP